MNNKYNLSSLFESDTLRLVDNILVFKKEKIEVILNENQVQLFVCLFNRTYEKKDIIGSIWPGKQVKSKENNLNQLIFQTRALLRHRGISAEVIMTMPRYGVCINRFFLATENERSVDVINGYVIIY